MKRIVLVLIAFCLSQITYSQTNIFPASGSVGIGTTTPSRTFDVFDSSWGYIRHSSGKYIEIGSDSQNGYLNTNGSLNIRLGANGDNTALTILNSGNVGIGTTTPARKLDILNGIIRLSDNYQIEWGGTANYIYGNGYNDYIAFVTNNAERLRIANGNVGIGTTTPFAGLTINKGGDTTPFLGIGSAAWGWHLYERTADGDILFKASNNSVIIDVLTLRRANAYVGIGTTTPNGKLDILSSPTDRIILGGSGFDTNSNSPKLSLFGRSGLVTGVSLQAISTGGWGGHRLAVFQHPSTAGDYTTENEVFSILDNGNVGISITNPQNKLDVAGTIRCTEVKVVALPWSDFVFHPTYKLRTLGEVEQFIKVNNHLPEIPTESEVKENGVGLGEMNAKLLQKIEELTLYMIEQNKKIERVEEQNDLLMKEVEQLKAK